MRAIDKGRVLAERQHGVIARRQLLEAGVGPCTIDRLVAAGAIERRLAGVYSLAGHEWSERSWLVAVALRCGRSAVATARSAARVWDMRVSRPPRPQILVPRSRRKIHVPEAQIFTTNRIESHDAVIESGVAVTAPARTIIELAADGTARLEDVIVDCVHERLISMSDLRTRALALERSGHSGPKRVLAALAALDPSTELHESVLEIELAKILDVTDLPAASYQYEVEVSGCKYRLDAAYPHLKLGVEADGYKWHSTPRQLCRDRERSNALALAGWMVLHYTTNDIRRHAARVRVEVEWTIRHRADVLGGQQ